MPRAIKRYDNRKLYDLDAKRYVRLSDLAEMIRAGDEIVVTDNATGADLTTQTLAKILSDREAGRGFLAGQSLHQLVRWGGELFGGGKDQVGRWFEKLLAASVERAAVTQEMRRELAELRERVHTLESIIRNLEEENKDGSDDNNDGRDRFARSAGSGESGG
jgi:polyhydroxyalkanoate synthesis repressor PhaR